MGSQNPGIKNSIPGLQSLHATDKRICTETIYTLQTSHYG